MQHRVRHSLRKQWGTLPLKEMFVAEYLRALEGRDPGKALVYAEALQRDFQLNVNTIERRATMEYVDLPVDVQNKVQQIESQYGLSREMAIIAATHPGTDTAEQMAKAMGTTGQGSNGNQGNENNDQDPQMQAKIDRLKEQYEDARKNNRPMDAVSIKNRLFNTYGGPCLTNLKQRSRGIYGPHSGRRVLRASRRMRLSRGLA